MGETRSRGISAAAYDGINGGDTVSATRGLLTPICAVSGTVRYRLAGRKAPGTPLARKRGSRVSSPAAGNGRDPPRRLSSMNQLSRYTLLEKIGSSILGAVYKARDNTTGSVVALKVLQLGLLDDVSSSEMDARLQRNFEAASRLQHPGIARVFEIRRDGRTALIASELVEGPTITSLTKNQT